MIFASNGQPHLRYVRFYTYTTHLGRKPFSDEEGTEEEALFCTASINGKECSMCMHNKLGIDFGSLLGGHSSHSSLSHETFCPDGDRIDIDCSNVAGQAYKDGHVSSIYYYTRYRIILLVLIVL